MICAYFKTFLHLRGGMHAGTWIIEWRKLYALIIGILLQIILYPQELYILNTVKPHA